MRDTIIVVLISVLIYGIVINHTYGRENRRVHILLKLLYLSVFIILAVRGFLLRVIGMPLLFLLVFFSYPYILYKYLQLSVRRLHDLNYSGWYLVVPVVSLYYIVLMYFKKGNPELNQYDVSINYTGVLKSLDMYPRIGTIYKNDNTYVINNQEMKMLDVNEYKILKCSKAELDLNISLRDYFYNSCTLEEYTELNSKYYYYFRLPQQGIDSVINDLNALLIEKNRLCVNGVSVFIRNENFQYGLLYSKADALPLIKENYVKCDNPYYNHYLLTKKQIADFFTEYRLTTASSRFGAQK